VRIDQARGGLPLAAATRLPHSRIVGLQSVGPTSASMRQRPSWPRAVLNAASSSPGRRRTEGARRRRRVVFPRRGRRAGQIPPPSVALDGHRVGGESTDAEAASARTPRAR
jgi:hypothetical protein